MHSTFSFLDITVLNILMALALLLCAKIPALWCIEALGGGHFKGEKIKLDFSFIHLLCQR